jgi:hypothetical protein
MNISPPTRLYLNFFLRDGFKKFLLSVSFFSHNNKYCGVPEKLHHNNEIILPARNILKLTNISYMKLPNYINHGLVVAMVNHIFYIILVIQFFEKESPDFLFFIFKK